MSRSTPELARIVDLETWNEIRPTLGRIVATSGGYDPIHPGHLSCLRDSVQHGDVLVAIVNGDTFLQTKKGKAFQDLATRCDIVSHVRGVDFVYPFEIEGDQTVIQALRAIRPNVFTKGGDRVDATTIPEWETCVELGIEVVTGVGREKVWSSSNFLAEWGEFWAEKHKA